MTREEGAKSQDQGRNTRTQTHESDRSTSQNKPTVGTNPVKGLKMSVYSISTSTSR